MNKIKSWLVMLVAATVFSLNAQAQAVPHTTMDYRWQEGWYHETSPYTDREGNSWSVAAVSYSRVSEMFYSHLLPSSWVTTAIAYQDSQGGWIYETTTSSSNSSPDYTPFYWEPEYYNRECYAYDENDERLMGSKVLATTELKIYNTVTRVPINTKHRSKSPFTANIYWQWIPIDAGCGEEGEMVTHLGSATYFKDSATGLSVAVPNQQCRILTFIAGKFPDPQ